MQKIYTLLILLLSLTLLPTIVLGEADYEFTVTKTTDTFDGTCDSDCSLREALTAACEANEMRLQRKNATILLDEGTYTLTRNGSDDSNVYGDLDIPSSCTYTDITFEGEGSNATIIDANGIDRALDVDSSLSWNNLSLKNLSIINGSTNGNGGAINAKDSRLYLTNVVLNNNTAGNDGGAVYVSKGFQATIINSSFTNNTAENIGGGLYVGTLTLEDSLIKSNFAENGGGGIYIAGDSYWNGGIIRSTITQNTANYNGGGIYFNPSRKWYDLSITESTISYNKALEGGYGSGVYAPKGDLVIKRSTFNNNTHAKKGGAIYSHATLTMINSTLYENSANSGGAIYNDKDAIINFSTFSKNKASSAPSIRNKDDATLKIKASIIARSGSSTKAQCKSDSEATITSYGYNSETKNSCGFNHETDRVNDNPKFSSKGLKDNGGPTNTVALKSVSPLISVIPENNCMTVQGDDAYEYYQRHSYRWSFDRSRYIPDEDQRNTFRSQENCTIGAYQPIPDISVVEGLADGNIRVKKDGENTTYSLYDTSTSEKLTIKEFDKTPGAAVVLKPNGEKISLVNLFSGRKIDTNKLSSTDAYSDTYLSTRNLYDRDIAIFVGRDRKSVKIHIFGLKNSNSEITSLASIKIHNSNVRAAKTTINVNAKTITLKNKNKKALYTYKITDTFELEER